MAPHLEMHTPMNQLTAFAPRYLTAFQCLGQECPDHCCGGWNIAIDQKTAQKYQKVSLKEMRDRLQKGILTIKGKKTSHHFKLDNDGNCTFLNADKLCDIQGTLGASHLCDTCAQYPRYYGHAGENYSVYATLSCPQAAKLALAEENAMDTIQVHLPFKSKADVPQNIGRVAAGTASEGEINRPDLDALQVFAASLHDTSCAFIRNPEISAAQALLAINMLFQRIKRHAESTTERMETIHRVASVILDANSPEHIPQLKEQALQPPAHSAQQLQLLFGGLLAQAQQAQFQLRIGTIIQAAASALHYQHDNPSASAPYFEEARTRWFEPFDNTHPHLLKNYLLNTLGCRLFPQGNISTLDDELMQISLRFALVRLLLIGVAAKKQENFGTPDYEHVIYSFGRDIEHNERFFPALSKIYADQDLRSTGAISVMIA